MQDEAVHLVRLLFLFGSKTGGDRMAQKLQPTQRKGLLITVAVLLLAGAGLAVTARMGRAVTWQVMAADILFSQASLILIWGMVRLLGNMRMFTSTAYSFRRFHDLLRGKLMKSSQMKDDYLRYRESRPYHPDARYLLAIGAVLMAVSVAVSFMAVS